MARRETLIVAGALLIGSAVVIAAAPTQGPPGAEPETNERIVADFFNRKEKAEKAQRAIILNLRDTLDRKRREFEEARKKFEEAQGRYANIVGPLAKQVVTNPDDPRLPYEFDVKRSGLETGGPNYRRGGPVQGASVHP